VELVSFINDKFVTIFSYMFTILKGVSVKTKYRHERGL
jgi:hypothetical protein